MVSVWSLLFLVNVEPKQRVPNGRVLTFPGNRAVKLCAVPNTHVAGFKAAFVTLSPIVT